MHRSMWVPSTSSRPGLAAECPAAADGGTPPCHLPINPAVHGTRLLEKDQIEAAEFM